jgi:hypothetical protein
LLLFVLFENFHVGNCRSETRSAFALPPWRSRLLLAGVGVALLAHLAAMYTPLGQRLLRTEAVGVPEWLVMIAVSSTIVAVMELHKLIWRWRR